MRFLCNALVVYCLTSHDGKRSYVGVTTDLKRRLRQHRAEIVGGARATTRVAAAADWRVACAVSGFATRRHALMFEWRWQHGGRAQRRANPKTRVSLARRLLHLRRTLALPRVTSQAPMTAGLTVHWVDDKLRSL
jgi:structure-specific endonuclease subunit SLX1